MKVGPKNQYRPTEAYGIKEGEILPDRKPGTLVWMRDRGRIYVTCKGCDAINDVTGHQLIHDGRLATDGYCFICVNCKTHYYFRLFGLSDKPAASIACDRCCRKEVSLNKGDIRRLRKAGWDARDKNGKRLYRCPGCVKYYKGSR